MRGNVSACVSDRSPGMLDEIENFGICHSWQLHMLCQDVIMQLHVVSLHAMNDAVIHIVSVDLML